MSLKPSLPFSFDLVGDGVDDSVTISFLTGPVILGPDTGFPVSAFEGVPTGYSLEGTGGLEVESSSLTLGVLSLTFTSAPAVGAYTITGRVVY